METLREYLSRKFDNPEPLDLLLNVAHKKKEEYIPKHKSVLKMWRPKERSLVHGVGIDDSDYFPETKPIRSKWASMIERCYAGKTKNYSDVFVCDEWLTFSNFKKWMEKQDWKNKSLDKDVMIIGNKTYSPEGCCFIPREINSLITARISVHSKEMFLGVSKSIDKIVEENLLEDRVLSSLKKWSIYYKKQAKNMRSK